MAYAILRTAKLKSFGEIGGSLSHNYRTRHTPNADATRTPDNSHSVPTAHGVMEAIKAHLPKKVRTNAVLAIEYLITASPDADVFKDPVKEKDFFDRSIEWLKKRHGADQVIATSIHRDETTPHLVAYIVPLDQKGKLNCREFLGGKAKLSKMQTDFHNEVKHLGLERGLEGSKAEHTTIQDFYSKIQQPTTPLQTPELKKIGPDEQPKSPFYNTKYEHGVRVLDAVYNDINQQLNGIKGQQDKQFFDLQKKLVMETHRADSAQKAHERSVRTTEKLQEKIEKLQEDLKHVIEYKAFFPKEFADLARQIGAAVVAHKQQLEQEKRRDQQEKEQVAAVRKHQEQADFESRVHDARRKHIERDIARLDSLLWGSTTEAEKIAHTSLQSHIRDLKSRDPVALMNSCSVEERESYFFPLVAQVFRAKTAADFKSSLDECIKLFEIMRLSDFKDVDPAATLKVCAAVDGILDTRLLAFGASHYKQVSEFKEVLYDCERQMQGRMIPELVRDAGQKAEIADHTRQLAEYNKNNSHINQKDKPKNDNDFSL